MQDRLRQTRRMPCRLPRIKVNGQIENIKGAASITDANAAYEEVKTTVDQAQADFDAKLGEYNTAKTAMKRQHRRWQIMKRLMRKAVNSADANAGRQQLLNWKQRRQNAEALAKVWRLQRVQWITPQQVLWILQIKVTLDPEETMD